MASSSFKLGTGIVYINRAKLEEEYNIRPGENLSNTTIQNRPHLPLANNSDLLRDSITNLFDLSGVPLATGEDFITTPNYTSNFIVADGDTLKEAIIKLDRRLYNIYTLTVTASPSGGFVIVDNGDGIPQPDFIYNLVVEGPKQIMSDILNNYPQTYGYTPAFSIGGVDTGNNDNKESTLISWLFYGGYTGDYSVSHTIDSTIWESISEANKAILSPYINLVGKFTSSPPIVYLPPYTLTIGGKYISNNGTAQLVNNINRTLLITLRNASYLASTQRYYINIDNPTWAGLAWHDSFKTNNDDPYNANNWSTGLTNDVKLVLNDPSSPYTGLWSYKHLNSVVASYNDGQDQRYFYIMQGNKFEEPYQYDSVYPSSSPTDISSLYDNIYQPATAFRYKYKNNSGIWVYPPDKVGASYVARYLVPQIFVTSKKSIIFNKLRHEWTGAHHVYQQIFRVPPATSGNPFDWNYLWFNSNNRGESYGAPGKGGRIGIYSTIATYPFSFIPPRNYGMGEATVIFEDKISNPRRIVFLFWSKANNNYHITRHAFSENDGADWVLPGITGDYIASWGSTANIFDPDPQMLNPDITVSPTEKVQSMGAFSSLVYANGYIVIANIKLRTLTSDGVKTRTMELWTWFSRDGGYTWINNIKNIDLVRSGGCGVDATTTGKVTDIPPHFMMRANLIEYKSCGYAFIWNPYTRKMYALILRLEAV